MSSALTNAHIHHSITDNDGVYSVPGTLFSFKFENNGAGARGNAFTNQAGLVAERARLDVDAALDDRHVKVATLREYYSVFIEHMRSGTDYRDYSERDLPYYITYMSTRQSLTFTPLPSYRTLRDNTIQVSLEGKEQWLQIVNGANTRLVQHLLQVRLDRRLVPTNANSSSVVGRYGGGSRFACEKRYLDGAKMVAKCVGVVEVQDLLRLQAETSGVGDKVIECIRNFFK